jgi:POT family proton-dependent oligopeptide transporter
MGRLMEFTATTGTLPHTTRRAGHPGGLAVLAFTEGCERFSFYGMQALLALYMLDYLLKPGVAGPVPGLAGLRAAITWVYGPQTTTSLASQIFGLYTAGVYLTPVIGSLLADRWLGRTRAIVIGALLMVAGHFAMAFDAGFIIALLLLVCGCGLVKGNIAAQVGGLYDDHDPRRTDAFQIFALAISVGVIAAPLVCGTLGERVGFHWGFATAGAGMLVSIFIYLAGRHTLPPETRTREGLPARPALTGAGWYALAAQITLTLILSVAFVNNDQIYGFYPVWARDNADLVMFGWRMPVTWFASVDALTTTIMLPLMVVFWRFMAARGVTPHELTKITGGTVCAVLAPLMLAAASALAERAGAKVSVPTLLAFHVVNALAFVNLYPVGLALVSRTAPAGLNATMVGVFYLLFVGTNLMVGWLGALYGKVPNPTFWLLHAGLVGGAAVALVVLYRPLRKALE